MANPKHLEIVRQGVEVWNEWRNRNHSIVPDLRGVDLSEQNLNKVNFSGVDFERCKDKDNSILTTKFEQASLEGADFSRANLRKSNLSKADLSNANLDGANLYNAQMAGTTLYKATLKGSVLNEACLKEANLQHANLMQALLIRTNLIDSDLRYSDLRLADLTEACLRGACMEGTNFTKAHVLKADLRKTRLTGACLEYWNNHGSCLEEVECDHVYLENYKRSRLPNHRDFYLGEFSRLFQIEHYFSRNRLAILEQTIIEFENLLTRHPEGNEPLFHDFLKNNPSLLDIYGIVESKPRFSYPAGEISLVGKIRLEPDFIIREPANRYVLVEIERPGKKVAIKKGHSSSEFTQAKHQLEEWERYITEYPHLLKEKYPGIATHRSYMLVIGRKYPSWNMLPSSIGGRPVEFRTYDDVLERAKQALKNLMALSI